MIMYLVVVEVDLIPFPPPPIDELVKEVWVKLDDPFPNKSFIPPKISCIRGITWCIPPPKILPKGDLLLKELIPPPSKLNGDRAPKDKN